VLVALFDRAGPIGPLMHAFGIYYMISRRNRRWGLVALIADSRIWRDQCFLEEFPVQFLDFLIAN
jgi:hypothetical protein